MVLVPLLPSTVPRWKEVTVPLPWHTPEVADTVFSTPDDGCVTPETCRVTWQWINVCILLHRVGPLLTKNMWIYTFTPLYAFLAWKTKYLSLFLIWSWDRSFDTGTKLQPRWRGMYLLFLQGKRIFTPLADFTNQLPIKRLPQALFFRA